jgi:hypothetical protein
MKNAAYFYYRETCGKKYFFEQMPFHCWSAIKKWSGLEFFNVVLIVAPVTTLKCINVHDFSSFFFLKIVSTT